MSARRDRTLRVATFNIRYDNPADGPHAWRHRRSAVRKCIDGLECDLVGLQEVLPRQRRYLRPRLRGMRWYGAGREDGRRKGEQSPLLVRRDRIDVERWRTVWLSSTPDVPGSTGVDARTPRVATVLHARFAGRPVGIINAHFDHRGAQARLDAARQLAALVAAEPDRAWVVCGDLNVGADGDPVRILTGEGLLRDVLAGHGTGTFHAFAGHSAGERIDHILVDAHWQIESAYVDAARPGGVIPSDHWPVVAALRLAGRPERA